MSSDFNYNFGLVVEEIFKLGHAIKSRCFDTKKNSYFDSSQRIIYTRIDLIWSKYCFAFVVDEFSWLRHTIRTSTHGHSCSKKLYKYPAIKKIMNNKYIRYPLKWSLKPPEIRVFQHFELLSPNTQAFCSYFSYFALFRAAITTP